MTKNRILIAIAILATAGFAACGSTDPDTVSAGLQTAAPVSADAAEQRAAPAAPRVAAAPVTADAADRRFTSEAATRTSPPTPHHAGSPPRRSPPPRRPSHRSPPMPPNDRRRTKGPRAPQTADAAERLAAS